MTGFRGRICALLLAALAAAAMGCGSGGDDTAERGKQLQDTTAAETSNPTEPKTSGSDALAEYERYLQGEAALLVKWTGRLEDEIARGEQFAATFKYSNSRVHYGHLQPAARLLGPLDSRVNAGFHEIERTLYGKETAAGLKPAARRLVADARRLRRALGDAEVRPLVLPRGAERLLEEASGRMMAGREEPNAGSDLVDVSASVEGAEKAFEAFEPLLEELDPRLVTRLERGFAVAYERLAEHGAPGKLNPGPEAGTFFVPYGDLDPVEIREISEPLDSLAQLFGEAAGQLGGA